MEMNDDVYEIYLDEFEDDYYDDDGVEMQFLNVIYLSYCF